MGQKSLSCGDMWIEGKFIREMMGSNKTHDFNLLLKQRGVDVDVVKVRKQKDISSDRYSSP